jgi:hypothetical protein
MNRIQMAAARVVIFTLVALPTFTPSGFARAGEPPRRWGRPVVVTRARPRPAPSGSTTLGTFQPTPTIWIGGSYPTGRGYSPMDIYGDQTLTLYGPLSAFRVSTAPILGYTRGYDGQLRVTEANSFSYPNLPDLSPVVYPTEANYFYGPRVNKTPRWGSNAINWIDQN